MTISVDEDLWDRFLNDDDDEARKALIAHYVPLANKVAGWMKSSLPAHVDYDDVRSNAYLGLIDAVSRFEPGRGFKFETFATPRIKGAVLDFLRGQDWAPRSLRSKSSDIAVVEERLTAELHRAPTHEELAEALDWEVDEVARVVGRVSQVDLIYFDGPADGEDGPDDSFHRDIIQSAPSIDRYDFDELRQNLASAIEELPDKERIVFTLFYFEGASLSDIGFMFGVTESRIYQILTHGAQTVRSRLDLDLFKD